MKYEKVTCQPRQEAKCHATLKKTHPLLISVSHVPNNHILYYATDYDKDGHVIQ